MQNKTEKNKSVNQILYCLNSEALSTFSEINQESISGAQAKPAKKKKKAYRIKTLLSGKNLISHLEAG
jgi:hypothetical protein